ncbi:MAG: hypothetical protein ACK56I_26270, partial [bacterium]
PHRRQQAVVVGRVLEDEAGVDADVAVAGQGQVVAGILAGHDLLGWLWFYVKRRTSLRTRSRTDSLGLSPRSLKGPPRPAARVGCA